MYGCVDPCESLRRSGLGFIFKVLLCICPVGAVIQSAVIEKKTGKLLLIEGYHADNVAWANFTDDIPNSG